MHNEVWGCAETLPRTWLVGRYIQISVEKYKPEPLQPCYLLSSMLKLTTFIHYEIIMIYTKSGIGAYTNCMGVRAVRVRW